MSTTPQCSTILPFGDAPELHAAHADVLVARRDAHRLADVLRLHAPVLDDAAVAGLGQVVHAHRPVRERAQDHLRDLRVAPSCRRTSPASGRGRRSRRRRTRPSCERSPCEEHLVGEAADDVTVCSHGSSSESARMAVRVSSPRRRLSTADAVGPLQRPWRPTARTGNAPMTVRRARRSALCALRFASPSLAGNAPETSCRSRWLDAAPATRGLHRRGHRRPARLRTGRAAAATRGAGARLSHDRHRLPRVGRAVAARHDHTGRVAANRARGDHGHRDQGVDRSGAELGTRPRAARRAVGARG